ncbi:MAG: GTPase ObgE [Clostridia bacterium]|nr:GTPase ObgE [Clostridia bacterium]
MSSFVDKTDIFIKAGKGGNGAVSFRREKYVSKGGPDGGDGGHGGNVVFRVDEGENTLVKFRYKRKFIAENGEDGKGKRCHGKRGEDLVISVPPGTIIRDKESGKVMFDLSRDKEFIAAKGGRGGWGNAHFATPTRQIPQFANPGLAGQEREITLEIKMLADVGLIGFPSVGKSTFISRASAARPKVAAYHFTTLSPILGVVKLDSERHFVMADLPGLIEGAGEGAGLGHQFLRHVERCRLFIHVVDGAGSEGRDPLEDIAIINKELETYDPSLLNHPQIIVANKEDLGILDETRSNLEKVCAEKGWKLFYISAESGKGIKEVIEEAASLLSTLPPLKEYEADFVEVEEEAPDYKTQRTTVTREGDVWMVEGEWLMRFIQQINFADRDQVRYFQKVMKDSGVEDAMQKAGVKDGDTVDIYGIEFDYVY